MRALKALIPLSLALLPVAAVQADCTPRSLSLAVIPVNDVETMKREHQPLLQRLSEATGVPVELVVAPSYEAVVDAITSGGVDIARLGPASYVQAHRLEPQIEVFASFTLTPGPYTPAGNQYQSLLLTRSADQLELSSLRGKRVALGDPASTSGSLIPSIEFAALVSRPLQVFFSALIYTGTHDRALGALFEGRVDAAFVASERADAYLASHHIDPASLRVLWRSAPIHHDPYVFSADLCPSVKTRIRRAMLDDQQALAAFFASQKASGLVAASHADYASLERILDAWFPAP